jgi:DNA-binding ferritin-like protein
MRRSFQRIKRGRKTRKTYGSKPSQSEEQKIVAMFLQMLNTVKLYHWKTHSYATHKATDELYSKLNENIDHFIEVLLGKSGQRTELTSQKSIRLFDFSSVEELKKEVYSFKGYLVSLNDNVAMKQMTNSDLLNIRDEILANMNQFLYLLTFK